jgi:hypothetical protein
MAIGTYGELKTAVASWLNRTDLTTVIPDFVTLGESDIRIDMRCQAMEQFSSGTLTGETLAHPTRYLEAKTLFVNGNEYAYLTPRQYQSLGDDATNSVFTSIGQSLYVKSGVSGTSYKLVYYQSFAAFSGDSDTNWLLTNYPDIYLSAACRHGAHYLKDSDEESKWAARYAGGVTRVMLQQRKAEAVGQLQVRAM